MNRRWILCGVLCLLLLRRGGVRPVGRCRGPRRAAVWVIPATARAFPDAARKGADDRPRRRRRRVRGRAGRRARGRGARRASAGPPAATRSSRATPRWREVKYVHVTHPSTDAARRPATTPTRSCRATFGAAVRMPAATAALYVLVHVPYGTGAGAATATLRVDNGAETVDLPVRLRVWDFGWRRLSTHTAFSLSTKAIKASLRGSVGFTGKRKDQLFTAYATMLLAARRHTDAAQRAAPPVGRFDRRPPVRRRPRALRRRRRPRLPRRADPLVQLVPREPEPGAWRRAPGCAATSPACAACSPTTAGRRRPSPSSSTSPRASTSEREAEKYAKLLHTASAAAGFRCRFLLTDDPRPTAIGGIKTANSFLFDDVDIWCTRYYYFFGRVPALRARRAAGDEIWWYTYANAGADQMPGYLIDKPLADQRVFGWLMQEWDVDGLLNWGTNRWGDPLHRQRLARPLPGPGLVPQEGRARGQRRQLPHLPRLLSEATGSPTRSPGPVSSLRLEALRDGLEDREYLRLASQDERRGGVREADRRQDRPGTRTPSARPTSSTSPSTRRNLGCSSGRDCSWRKGSSSRVGARRRDSRSLPTPQASPRQSSREPVRRPCVTESQR